MSPDINIFTYPELPDGMGEGVSASEESVLLFPSDTSVEVDALDWSNVKRILLIDSTWITCNQVLYNTHKHTLTHN